MTLANEWIRHIKDVRREHGVDLADAERVALAEPHWRRWLECRINTDIACRRMALAHIRSRGAGALIAKEGDRLVVLRRGED